MSKYHGRFLLLFLVFPFLVFSQKQTNLVAIKGIIVDQNNDKLQGITVKLTELAIATFSDENGFFSFVNIPSDTTYSLEISGFSFQNKSLKVELKGNQNLDLKEIVVSSILEIEEVNVNGKLENSEAKALNMMKNANKQTNVVSAEELDKLPIKNAADAVAHVPGVNVQRNQGENSIVTLRGTPGDWASTLLNGDRLPVADEEQQTRSFEFESLPAEVIDYVIESKTITPDMESDNIGGNINFITRQPVSKKTFKYDIAAGVNAFSQKPTGSFTTLFGNISKNKKFSFVSDFSYYGRNYALNTLKAIYGSTYNHALNRLELRRYDGVRTTIGGNFGMTYLINSKLKLGSNFVAGYMKDDKYMKKESINWYDDSGTDAIRLQSTHGVYNRRIFGGDLFAEYQVNSRFQIKAKFASYDNRFWFGAAPFKDRKDSRNGFFVTEFISDPIQFTDRVGVDKYGNASSNPYAYVKLIGADNPYGTGDAPNNIRPQFATQLSTSQFHFNQSYTETNQTRERDPIVVQLDGTIKCSNFLKLQVGGKFTHKIGYRHISKHDWFQDYSNGNSQPILLSDFSTESFMDNPSNFMIQQGSSYDQLLFPFLTNDELNNFISNDNIALREVYMNQLNYQYNQWVGSSYDYKEDKTAAYGMFEYAKKKINFNGGLRIENTHLIESSDTLTSNIGFYAPTQTYYYLPEKRFTRLNYLSILPSFNFTFFKNDKTNIRFAASRTMHRPNFEETKPGHAVIRYNELEYTFGNPNLKPTYSLNLDASYEHFWGLKGMFLVGGYYKNIKDHIFAVSTGAVDSLTGIVTKRYENAPNSWIVGLEAIFIRKLDFLPGFGKNFAFNANLTYSLSRMQVPGRTNSQAMVGQTPLLFNLGISYESKKIESKIELAYSGKYLKQLNLSTIQGVGLLHKNGDYDVYANRYWSLDFEFTFLVNDSFSIFLEGNNLLNSPDRLFIGQEWRPYRIEYYGFKSQIGVKFEL
jgi:TonB-dependent receptor